MLTLHAMTCGWMTIDLGAMLEGESGRIRIPVPSYLIRHPRGLVLYDTGLHKSMQTDADARLGVIARMFGIDYEPKEDVAARLEGLDVSVMMRFPTHLSWCNGKSRKQRGTLIFQEKLAFFLRIGITVTTLCPQMVSTIFSAMAQSCASRLQGIRQDINL